MRKLKGENACSLRRHSIFYSAGLVLFLSLIPLLTDLRIYRHVDLYYEDGGNPTEEILQAFLQICETERGAIAVHCKAGLGRTGTNIAAYMIKHYGYTAKETMAWCR
jgi:protein tyrosine phosphatase